MRGFQFLSVTVGAAALKAIRPQIWAISNAGGCLLMVYGFKSGGARFVLAVPHPKVESVEQALRRLEGIAVLQAQSSDIQQFGSYQVGKVESELEF